MANDNAAVHEFRLLKVPLDSTRLSSNIPALLVFTTDTSNLKLAPAIRRDGRAPLYAPPSSNGSSGSLVETKDSTESDSLRFIVGSTIKNDALDQLTEVVGVGCCWFCCGYFVGWSGCLARWSCPSLGQIP